MKYRVCWPIIPCYEYCQWKTLEYIYMSYFARSPSNIWFTKVREFESHRWDILKVRYSWLSQSFIIPKKHINANTKHCTINNEVVVIIIYNCVCLCISEVYGNLYVSFLRRWTDISLKIRRPLNTDRIVSGSHRSNCFWFTPIELFLVHTPIDKRV